MLKILVAFRSNPVLREILSHRKRGRRGPRFGERSFSHGSAQVATVSSCDSFLRIQNRPDSLPAKRSFAWYGSEFHLLSLVQG